MDSQINSNAKGHPFDLQHLCRYFSERSPVAMLAVEGTTHIVRHVNAAFTKLSGISRHDLVGHTFAKAVPEGLANHCESLLDRVYSSAIPESLAEQKHGEGVPVYWSYAVWAILGDDERPAGVMIQVTDSTETAVFRHQVTAMNESLLLSSIRQQELTEVAEAAVKEKQLFIAVLSHELRAPLAPLLVASSMLQQNERLDPEMREVLQMFHRNIVQEARLIDDLLDMTRMERGKLELDLRPVDLRSALEHAVEGCRPELEPAELTLDVNLGTEPQIVHADAGRMQQVFSNLLRNAVKFTPAGGKLRVRCYRDADSYAVEVRDSGVGIDPEFLPSAFNAFEQGEQTGAHRAGLGLGLAISKTIVDLHGGRITALSEGKGRGATFIVALPALVGVQPVEAKPVELEAPRPVKPLRILFVEDEPDTARAMRHLLKSDGHTVHWAPDVAAGVKLGAENHFDLLLSDLGLPDGTGIDLMRSLRQQGSTFPGIVLSGYGQDQDLARTKEAGFVAHLVKPLSVQMLRDAIAMVAGS